MSSAITRCGSRKACWAAAKETPCLAWFSLSFSSSHSKMAFLINVLYQDLRLIGNTKVWKLIWPFRFCFHMVRPDARTGGFPDPDRHPDSPDPLPVPFRDPEPEHHRQSIRTCIVRFEGPQDPDQRGTRTSATDQTRPPVTLNLSIQGGGKAARGPGGGIRSIGGGR